MTRPFCLTLRAAVVACANARPRRCELASLVCHFVPYQNSGVLWTYELILGVLETSDYSVYAQYRSWVLYLDTRAALGGAQITIITTSPAVHEIDVNVKYLDNPFGIKLISMVDDATCDSGLGTLSL